LEKQIQARQVGEIVGLAAGKGEMDVALLVADPVTAETALRTILREINLEDRSEIVYPAKR
jgi:hypothetical protein